MSGALRDRRLSGAGRAPARRRRTASPSRRSASSSGGGSASTSSRWSSLFVVVLFYLVAVFADFLAYADPRSERRAPRLHPAAGDPPVRQRRRFRPYVYGLKGVRDPQTFKLVYRVDDDAQGLP